MLTWIALYYTLETHHFVAQGKSYPSEAACYDNSWKEGEAPSGLPERKGIQIICVESRIMKG